MTSLTRTLFTSLLLLLQLQAFADTEKIIKFENQREEIFDLENWLKEITYTEEQVESTCYRTEYRTENVCRNVTRYRQECRTIPSHQECRTINDPICTSETRYERECRNVPGEQECRVVVRYRRECSSGRPERQCHTVPGDVQCRIINGENRCTKIPPREVCEDRPGRQECRDVPYEERECRTGPSRQECRDVPRQHQVCRDHYRQICETVPAERVCEQIPYQVQECNDEQVPYQVPYRCMRTIQVPHEKILKTHKAHVQVTFNAKAADLETIFKVGLTDKGDMLFSGNDQRHVLAFLKKDIKTEATGDINNITALYNVDLYKRSDLAGIKYIRDMKLSKESLNFDVEGQFDPKRASLKMVIKKKEEILCDKTLKSSQFKTQTSGGISKVSVDLKALGCKVAGAVVFNKTRKVELRLKLDFTDLGIPVGRDTDDVTVSAAKEIELE